MKYQNRLYIWSPLFSPERTGMSRGYIMTLLPVQPDTPQWGGAVLIGFHHHGEPGLPSMTVFATVSRGYWLPIDGVHWLDLEFTPESLESLNTVGRFFWRGGMRAQGFAGRTQRSYSLRGWRPCSESKLYFTPFHPASWHHWLDNYWITFIKEMEF